MIHLGDVTKIKGYEAPVVDCLVGGSPCQDLSVAGKRAGLAGERSGLFMEQIRIIKEMREHDRANGRTGVDVRCRYGIWENVPGALSSPGKGHSGEDFAAVLEEFIRVSEPEAPPISVPEKGWPTAGCYYDAMGKWSVAWRVMDSQYWGVPQRRRRICLVADFNGLNAPKIVFGEAEHHGRTEQSGGDPSVANLGIKSRPKVQPVTEGLHGNPDSCQPQGQETAGDVGAGSGGAVPYTLKIRSGVDVDSQGKAAGKGALIQTDKTGTLSTVQDQYLFQPIISVDQGGGKSSVCTYDGVSPTLTRTNDGAPAVAYTYDARGNGDGHMVSTITGDHNNRITDYTSVVLEPVGEYWNGSQVAGTLTANNAGGGQRMPDKENFNCVVQKVEDPIAIDRAFFNQGKNAQYEPQCYEDGTVPTLVAKGPGAVVHGVDCRVKHIVRRLTPLECERLQGFPDGWTDIGEWIDTKGKKHKEADSPRYKALGNSIALPPWKWVLKRLCACYERDATLASLFDGIGGFPYIWEQLNGKGSCLWASEIEEFPIAVTKLRFGGNNNESSTC